MPPIFALPILSQLEDLLKWALEAIHESSGFSWAWSIVALTVLLRIAMIPFTVKQTQSTLAMGRLQPHMKKLREKYSKDRQELNAQMMQFYRDNKVNPFASCLPLLIQMPFLFAMFFVLKNFAKHPPAAPDNDFSWLWGAFDSITETVKHAGLPAWILVVAYVVSQMISTRVMMTTVDPLQKKLFTILPIFFVLFIVNFPVGLVMFWFFGNVWAVCQHIVVVSFTNTDIPVILPSGKATKTNAEKGSNPVKQAAVQPPNVRRNKRRK